MPKDFDANAVPRLRDATFYNVASVRIKSADLDSSAIYIEICGADGDVLKSWRSIDLTVFGPHDTEDPPDVYVDSVKLKRIESVRLETETETQEVEVEKEVPVHRLLVD